MRAFYKFRQLVELLASVGSRTLGADSADVGSVVKHRESVSLHDVHQFDKLHPESQVGLVASVIFHSVAPRHAQERLVELYSTKLLEQVFRHTLKHLDDVFLLHEAHFAVDLRELRLTVGAQVLVAEAFHDLEVAVESRDH